MKLQYCQTKRQTRKTPKILNSREITKLANKLIPRYLSNDWKFIIAYEKYPDSVAWCNTAKKEIALNVYYVGLLNSHEIYDILLHEIAHGLTPKGCLSHGVAWRRRCRAIGGSGYQFIHSFGRQLKDPIFQQDFHDMLSSARQLFSWEHPELMPTFSEKVATASRSQNASHR